MSTLFIPPRYCEKEMEFAPTIYAPDDRLYIVDSEGNVHYFKYLGKNLALGN